MHIEFPETKALLLQLVNETMINAIVPWNKWLNEAVRTQTPHSESHSARNHAIEQSTGVPVLKL